MKNISLMILLLLISLNILAQQLKPGFNKNEYLDLLKISAQFGDSAYAASIPVPSKYSLEYRSPVFGLDNMWDLYTTADKLAVISLRGTTEKSESWLANFYAAMVPASGSMKLSNEDTFDYNLATNPEAAVHVGWLVSTGFLSKDILPKIDSCYNAGFKDFIIMGHSQGGAIGFLLTAHFYSLQQQGIIPGNLRFKTYCSAGPKPGNLYFAYNYEAMTQNGWAFNVVNSADWVPEVPVSIQTVDDFNVVNPFVNAKAMIKKQKFLARVAMNHAYNKLYKPTKKAQKNYQKLLGDYTSKTVQKVVPGFVPPAYYPSNNYVRTGNTIVLKADEAYYKNYPNEKDKIFMHHFHPPYLFLAEKLNFSSSFEENHDPENTLEGTWELDFIPGSNIVLDDLYLDKKPVITFNLSTNKINGNTSCNNFMGSIAINGNTIHFDESLAMTKMKCSGEGEQVFLEKIKKVNKYNITEGSTLTFIMDDSAVMIFKRK